MGETSICKKKNVLDIRSVRGPVTRNILMDLGYDVPSVYGDPAILLPLFYNPIVEKNMTI